MHNEFKFNLLFDFDGTLADSFCVAMQKLILLADEFNFHKINPTEIEQLKQLTSRELIKFLKIPLYKLPGVLHQARESIRNEIPTLSIFNDLPEVLTELHHLGCCLGIVTSNSSENVSLWLKRHQIQHLFDFIHAESSYFGKKQILKKIIKSHKMESYHTFYIGDETRDVEAAQKCNINAIAVSWGFNSEETLVRSKPNYVAKTPKDILTILNEHKIKLNPF
ncbi:MAG: HAD hydrolase-like protein [Tatlockia sp.]|jgi:phosphoglycolate phosphatase